jgi:hypothetical protein
MAVESLDAETGSDVPERNCLVGTCGCECVCERLELHAVH